MKTTLLSWWTISSSDSWMRRCLHLKWAVSVRFLHLFCEKEQRSNAERNQKEYYQTQEHLIYICKRILKCKTFQSWEHKLRLAVIGQVNYKKIEIQTLVLNANNIRIKSNSQMEKNSVVQKNSTSKIRYEEKNLRNKQQNPQPILPSSKIYMHASYSNAKKCYNVR